MTAHNALPSSTNRRLLRLVAIAALVAAVVYVLRPVGHVLLLLFSAVLLGIFLHKTAWYLSRSIHLPRPLALALVIIGIAGTLILFAWWAGPAIADQATGLVDRLKEGLQRLQSVADRFSITRALVEGAEPATQMIPDGASVLSSITGVFSSALESLTSLLIVLLVGIYLALQPGLYVDTAVRVIPRDRRGRVCEVIVTIGDTLWLWLLARLASMAVVGLLTALGLWAIGLPLAFVLAVIAGLLSFIPFLGPVLSVIPALLVALVEGMDMVLYVGLVYFGIQQLESYFITPLIEQRTVSQPPALLIAAQLLLGAVFRLLGVMLASPIVLVVILLVQMLYIEDVLGEKVTLMGKRRNGE
jgi:predicted PurR-regulated permease PerM